MSIEDTQYICANLGNLSGLPVRLYENSRQILFYSIVNLPKDPFSLSEENALSLEDDIGYYETPYHYYYGILNYQKLKIVVGPTRQLPISTQDLKAIAFSLGVPVSSVEDFIAGMQSLVAFPLMSMLQMLCMVYFAFTGKRKTLDEIAIHEEEQTFLKGEIEKDESDRAVASAETYARNPYNAFDTENRLMDMVMRGDLAAINEYVSRMPAVRSGIVAQEQLRQSKNIFIVTTTLASRAAIRGGMEVTSALALSDTYIQKCELCGDTGKITELLYRMILDYAEKVAKVKLGSNPSPLVIKVSNYIQQHLSEPIKAQDISRSLYMGRSRLSTNFKKQTGISLSDYIMMQKIDEAKRFLRYSDKSFTAISLYLGFSSHSHFTKVFKKYAELTPFEYRQLHKHY